MLLKSIICKEWWPDFEGIETYKHLLALAFYQQVKSDDPTLRGLRPNNRCHVTAVSTAEQVRNIDPIWGDCDQCQPNPVSGRTSCVRNIDPIWGDCDIPRFRIVGFLLTPCKKHWPDLRGLRPRSVNFWHFGCHLRKKHCVLPPSGSRIISQSEGWSFGYQSRNFNLMIMPNSLKEYRDALILIWLVL